MELYVRYFAPVHPSCNASIIITPTQPCQRVRLDYFAFRLSADESQMHALLLILACVGNGVEKNECLSDIRHVCACVSACVSVCVKQDHTFETYMPAYVGGCVCVLVCVVDWWW